MLCGVLLHEVVAVLPVELEAGRPGRHRRGEPVEEPLVTPLDRGHLDPAEPAPIGRLAAAAREEDRVGEPGGRLTIDQLRPDRDGELAGIRIAMEGRRSHGFPSYGSPR